MGPAAQRSVGIERRVAQPRSNCFVHERIYAVVYGRGDDRDAAKTDGRRGTLAGPQPQARVALEQKERQCARAVDGDARHNDGGQGLPDQGVSGSPEQLSLVVLGVRALLLVCSLDLVCQVD